MNTSAAVMLLIGVIGLWGTLALAIWNYLRKAGSDAPPDG